MTDRRNQLAVAVMAGKLIADSLKGTAEREEIAQILTAEDTKKVPVRDADGTELGTATLCGGKEKAKVTDELALLRWVKANRPDQIREIVEDAFVKALLKQADKDGVAVDETTGEVIPGIELVETNTYVNVTPNDTARERMTALVAESGLLQLTKARRVVAELPPAPTFAFEGLDDGEASPW
jgi:hypothetical protein